MKKIQIIAFSILTLMLLRNAPLYAQCDLPKPPGSYNLCNPMLQTTIVNTSNSITIDNAGEIPPSGACTITISYYDETSPIPGCAPVINCPTASVNTSGSTVTLLLNNCDGLPDLAATAIFYINIETSTGIYFYHVRNYSCDYVLGINNSTSNVEEKKVAPVFRTLKNILYMRANMEVRWNPAYVLPVR
jgi:hypothetical protein